MSSAKEVKTTVAAQVAKDDVDINDMFDSLLYLEEDIYDAAKVDGLSAAKEKSVAQGKLVGHDKGNLIGNQMGFILGCVRTWTELGQKHPETFPPNALKLCANIEQSIHAFPVAEHKAKIWNIKLQGIR
jgi:hypothetical protein